MLSETLQATYRSKPQLLNLSSMYQANVPQYNLAIDRDKVQLLGLQLNQVFSTLSYYMGATYVNDFVEFGAYLPGKDRGQRPSLKKL